jgi:hypothetical protein
MKRVRSAAVLAAGACLSAALLAAVAVASPPAAVTIHELTVFGGPHQPPSGAFTASGLPGCSSGTFSDQVISFSPSGARIKLARTYACAGGGSLTARVALHLAAVDASGGQAVTGRWRIISSDGLHPAPAGRGSVVGENTGCAPVGEILAECAVGTGTVSATVH